MRPPRRVLLWCVVCSMGLIAGAGLLVEAAEDGEAPLVPRTDVMPAPTTEGPGPALETDEGAVDAAPADPFAEPPPPPPAAANDRPPLRDPTQPGPELRDILVPLETAGEAAGPPVMPRIRLKGRVIVRGRPGTALLEVDGALLSMQEGGEATVSAGRTGLVTVRLLELTDSLVRLEVLPQEQEIVLR